MCGWEWKNEMQKLTHKCVSRKVDKMGKGSRILSLVKNKRLIAMHPCGIFGYS